MFTLINKTINRYLAFPFLFLIFLASSYYLLQSGFFYVHDFPIAARIAEMANGLRAGHFPVRWSANFGYGFGMPLFNFYAPLPYVLGALLYYLNNNLITLIKVLYLLINFFTLWGSYKLGKRLGGLAGGLALAALFTLAPYRALLLFVRGALSEAFAISFFPWASLAVVELMNKSGQNYKKHLLLFFSLLAIVLSHNLSALMFIPLLLIFAMLTVGKKRLEVFLTFFFAGLAASFYIVPTFFEQNLTRVSAIFTDYFDYRLHFVYIRQLFWDNWGYGGSAWGVEDDISFFLGYGQYFALLLMVLFFLKNFYVALKKDKLKIFLLSQQLKTWAFLFFFFLLTLFLTLQKSQFFWSILPVFAYLQFPWRWFGVSFFFLASSFSASLILIKKPLLPYLVTVLLIFLSLTNFRYFRAHTIIDNPEKYYTGEAEKIASQISQTLPDYIPIQMAKQETLAEFNQNYPQPIIWSDHDSENLAELDVRNAQLIKQQNHRQVWSVNLTEKQLLNFKLANFPGWRAKVNGQTVEVLTNPKLGNIQLQLEPGEYEIELFFAENRLRLIANYLSLFFTIAFFIWLDRLKKTANS